MKAATGAVHTHTCVPCSACLLRGLRLRRPAVAPQATGWLLAPGSTRSLRPAARAAWVRSARARCVSCWCTPRAVGTSGASANAKTATMRATMAAVHTRACVPCSACGWSHYATTCPLATRDASNCSTGEVAVCVRAPIGGRIATSLDIVQSVYLPDSNDEGCNGGGAYPRVCAMLDLPVSLCSAVASQATGWLLAPGSTRSLRPAARAAWERSTRASCV